MHVEVRVMPAGLWTDSMVVLEVGGCACGRHRHEWQCGVVVLVAVLQLKRGLRVTRRSSSLLL